MTVGEFTLLDPESCIAGEDGRSEVRGVGGVGVDLKGSNLRHLIFTDWLAVKSHHDYHTRPGQIRRGGG